MYRREQKLKQGIKTLKGMIRPPFDSSSDGVDIEVIRDRHINIDGCTEIEEFTDSIVIFKGKNMRVKVFGENIELYTFADGRIRASGTLYKIELERGGVRD